MTLTDDATPTLATAADLLEQARAARQARDAEEVRILLLALAWADRHVVAPPAPMPEPVSHLEATPRYGVDSEQALRTHESTGLPELAWHAGASFGTALGLSTAAGDRLLRDALILSVRLPRVFTRVVAGEVPVWRARRVAEAAVGQPDDVVTYLDIEIAPIAEKIGVTTLDRIVDAVMLALYPEEREIAQLEALDARYVTLHEESMNHVGIADMSIRGDWADLAAFNDTVAEVAAAIGLEGAEGEYESLDVRRAMAVGILADPQRAARLLGLRAPTERTRRRRMGLVVHLTEANLLGIDPVATDSQQRAFLTDLISRWAGRTDTDVDVGPVMHCGGCPDCSHDTHTDLDVYQPSTRDRGTVELRDRKCQFPYCSRSADRCDLDHRIPFDHDHPDQGGETCPCNLTPLCRHHHRLKTHAGWTYTCVEPAVYLWRDRYGQTFLRSRSGTTDLMQDVPPWPACSTFPPS